MVILLILQDWNLLIKTKIISGLLSFKKKSVKTMTDFFEKKKNQLVKTTNNSNNFKTVS